VSLWTAADPAVTRARLVPPQPIRKEQRVPDIVIDPPTLIASAGALRVAASSLREAGEVVNAAWGAAADALRSRQIGGALLGCRPALGADPAGVALTVESLAAALARGSADYADAEALAVPAAS
jgi:hypothetical protein